MESIIESLEKFGLTRYEAKAYIGMTNLISENLQYPKAIG